MQQHANMAHLPGPKQRGRPKKVSILETVYLPLGHMLASAFKISMTRVVVNPIVRKLGKILLIYLPTYILLYSVM